MHTEILTNLGLIVILGSTSWLDASAQRDFMQSIVTGDSCKGGVVVQPYSVTYIDSEVGEITHTTHIACDGTRSTSVDKDGKMFSYKAYDSFLHRDNTPSVVGIAHGGGIYIRLEKPASVRITDAHTGLMLATYPSLNEMDVKEYTVPASLLTAYVGHLIVVDVIRLYDKSYRGTKSIEYNPHQ